MPAKLNHTIVAARDHKSSALFLSEILGLAPPLLFGPFALVKVAYWADPYQRRCDEINRWDDGRGAYFEDPNGHLLEILTRPYGSAGTLAENPHPLVAQKVGHAAGGQRPAHLACAEHPGDDRAHR